MLAQVALVVFALMAMLGLIVDTGLLRVTHGQMQTAADGAAIEGLRNRDAIVQAAGASIPVPNAFANDCVRRTAARRVATAVFDDTLYAADGDPGYQFGAGPVVARTSGTTSLHAGQTIAAEAPYDPRLQLNQQNAVYGDMVSGRFAYTESPLPSEDALYGRTDFTPATTQPTPPPTLPECPDPDDPVPATWPASSAAAPLTSAEHEAFLVRLRRSNELSELEGQTEPGVASSGPSLPLLFGHGAPIHGDSPDAPYSVRRDGFTVRAAAIAQVRPAMQVGLPRTTAPAQPGVTPFAVVDTFAGSAVPATGAAVTVDAASGVICTGLTCAGAAAPTAIGRFVSNSVTPVAGWLAMATVGQAVPAGVAVTCATALPRAAGYGPVYATIGGTARVIGFTLVQLARDPARPANLCAGLLLRAPSRVAAANATATLPTTLPLPANASAAAVRGLLDRHFQATYQPVLAPALAQ